jgi:phage terminase small subunit
VSPKPLSAQHQRFVEEYLVDLNATQAAARAGYSKKTARVQGSRLLLNAAIAAAISTATAARSERVEVKADEILRELMRAAFLDPADLVDDEGKLLALKKMRPEVRRAIGTLEVTTTGSEESGTAQLTKVKPWDKLKALELLGKHLKLFTDRVEHSGAVSIAVVDPYATEKPRG